MGEVMFEGVLGDGIAGEKREAADAVGEAFVEGVIPVGWCEGGGKEDEGGFEGAVEFGVGDLTDGVAVGMHFVDVFALRYPAGGVLFTAVFGVEGVDGARGVWGMDFKDNVGAQVMGERLARGGCVGGVV